MPSDQSQAEVIAFLSDPHTFGGQPVERIDTHISHLFLAGNRCYKLKRAVKFSFLDFSTVARRKQDCEREVMFNRRTAPDLYLGVTPITVKNGHLQLGGNGAAVDWVVEMVRFDPDETLDHLAAQGRLTSDIIANTADALAEAHIDAERCRGDDGVASMMAAIKSGNDMLNNEPAGLQGRDQAEHALARLRQSIGRSASQLSARHRHGYVRHCHGDLHLANVCLFQGRPTIFDAIEFNDDLSAIDVLYDAAFFIMDLLRFQQLELANAFMNRYLSATRDYAGLSLLPMFIALRALIRFAAQGLQVRKRDAGEDAGIAYLQVVEKVDQEVQPHLITIGGRSGTGKSRLSEQLAVHVKSHQPGAVILNSDVIRKRMFNIQPEARLNEASYAPSVTEKVYRRICKDARRSIRASHTVICDASFLSLEHRTKIESVAQTLHIPIHGLWPEAPEETLMRRVSTRTNDVSDADAIVVRRQGGIETGLIQWSILDASRSLEKMLAAAVAVVSS